MILAARVKSDDLILFSSYIDFLISHVNSHFRNWSVFDFSLLFGCTDVHWFKLNIQNMIFEVKFHAESNSDIRKINEIYR